MNRAVDVDQEAFQDAAREFVKWQGEHGEETGELQIDPNEPHPVKSGRRLRNPNEQKLPPTPHQRELQQQPKVATMPVTNEEYNGHVTQAAVDISTIINTLTQQYGIQVVKFGHDETTGLTTFVTKL